MCTAVPDSCQLCCNDCANARHWLWWVIAVVGCRIPFHTSHVLAVKWPIPAIHEDRQHVLGRKGIGQAQLGDSRLSQRLVTLATRLAEAPSASLPQACRGWAEVQAAYCFLSQDKVKWQDILQPHWDASLERIKAHPVVLCLQDTTESVVLASEVEAPEMD